MRSGTFAPPEYTKIPPMGRMMSPSISRTDRMGPTRSVAVEWKTARKRVMRPSTSSS